MPEEQIPTQPDSTQSQPPVAPPASPVEAGQKPAKLSFLKNPKFKLPLIIVAVMVVVLGASAGAYYGVIVPSKPENVLKSAVVKQLEKKQQAIKGSLSVDLKNEDIKNITVNFKGASDAEKNSFDVSLEAAVSGAKLPLDIRGVDKSIFLRVGDLKSIKSLAKLAGGEEIGSIVDAIGDKLSNQWIEIDESLLKQANAECTTDLAASLTQKDIDQLLDVYGKNAFVDIKNTSADTIDGKAAKKYELGLDTKKAESFAGDLKNLDYVKKLSECGETATKDAAGDKEVGKEIKDAVEKIDLKFYVWIDGGKNIRQIQALIEDKEVKSTFTMTFTDDKVEIKEPEGAKPLMEVIGDFTSMFGLSGGLPGATSQSMLESQLEGSGMSAECTAAFQKYISSGGTTAPPTDCM